MKKPCTKGYYKKTHMDKYLSMKECMQDFMKEEVFLESVHTMSNPKNEAMNNSIARLCPKSKHFWGTATLLTRVYVAVAYCNMGVESFYQKLFSVLNGTESPICFVNRMGNKIKRDRNRQKKLMYK